jgi:predicted amidohydrolase
MYDLVVKGGTVLAPGDQLHGRLDIAIEQGKIVRIAPDIHEPARRVVDVRGALVTPASSTCTPTSTSACAPRASTPVASIRT